jgi:hypothetical protein
VRPASKIGFLFPNLPNMIPRRTSCSLRDVFFLTKKRGGDGGADWLSYAACSVARRAQRAHIEGPEHRALQGLRFCGTSGHFTCVLQKKLSLKKEKSTGYSVCGVSGHFHLFFLENELLTKEAKATRLWCSGLFYLCVN